MDKNIRFSTIPETYRSMEKEKMEEKISEIKQRLGSQLFLPCHHYQKDEVFQFADATGDSLQLAKLAAENRTCRYIVFCGVHFMAETADILSADHQEVILPDKRAGCSMADMASLEQVERGFRMMTELFGETIIPLTYVNSTAGIKAFCGRNGGATVTSANAKRMFFRAWQKKERILFLPDQHLGRNTAFSLGVSLNEMAVWDPIHNRLENKVPLEDVKIILWKGHCSVHQNFTVENIYKVKKTDPSVQIIVHPECHFDVVQEADVVGSTSEIIRTISHAASGTKWAVGTEMNLVQRLAKQHPDKHIFSLNPLMCPCLTMNRIDLPHLLWALENINDPAAAHRVIVDDQTARDAKKALDAMFIEMHASSIS